MTNQPKVGITPTDRSTGDAGERGGGAFFRADLFVRFFGGSLLDQMNKTRVVRCDEAAWRLFGLSLAGYNVLISLLMAAIALWGFVAAAKRT